MKVLFFMACLFGSVAVAAMQPRDLRGLDVTVEPIPEELVVDGLALRITGASGRDIPALAQRMQERWRAEGSPVQVEEQQQWHIASRLDQGRNELIQWRGEGAAARLLHSSLATGQSLRRRATAPFALPAVCAWGRVIEGASAAAVFEQHSARCRSNPAALAAGLRARLQREGWSIRLADAVWELSREGSQARLTIIEGPGREECSLVWLAVRSGERR